MTKFVEVAIGASALLVPAIAIWAWSLAGDISTLKANEWTATDSVAVLAKSNAEYKEAVQSQLDRRFVSSKADLSTVKTDLMQAISEVRADIREVRDIILNSKKVALGDQHGN